MAAHRPSMNSLFKDGEASPSPKSASDDDEAINGRNASPKSLPPPVHDLEKQLDQALASSPSVPTLPQDDQRVDPTLVEWDGDDDPQNPLHWSFRQKAWMTFLVALMTLCISITSSIWSEDVGVTAKEFGTSKEIMILGVSLYVLGFACGPLVFAPISELMGRSRPLVLGFFCYAIFQIPVAVAQNLETIFISRFLAAAFGASAVAIAPGILVDLWEPAERGIATLLWALTVFAGPTVGPLVGAFTVENPALGWRWTAWLMLILGLVVWAIAVPTTQETFAPILLQRKAARLRYETRNWALHSKRDEDPLTWQHLAVKYGLKPLQMLIQEPILACITAYMSLVYAIIYIMFVGYPYAFGEVRGWSLGTSSLPFIGLFIGYVVASVICILESKLRFQRLLQKNNGHFEPEERLPTMIAGSVIIIVGLFWFAWTSSPSISWVPQVIAGVPIGCGIFIVFVPGQVYIMDVYTSNAASAMAGNAFVRAALACAFPLAAESMYETLGIDWGMSLLAFLCVALAPCPILFYVFGPRLRKLSKYVPR